MKLKEIEALIKFVQKTGVSEVNIEQDDWKITIKTHPSQPVVQGPIPVAAVPTPVPVVAVAPPAVPAPAPAVEPVPSKPQVFEESKYIPIKSPMIGTFYRSSSPDKPPFVNVGDKIEAGKPICIIEAMKLFNEIESEVSGKIVKVLVDNASPVEYDQPLFLVEPA